jgi:hypothetical protein
LAHPADRAKSQLKGPREVLKRTGLGRCGRRRRVLPAGRGVTACRGWAQAVEGDGDEAAGGGLGGQAVRRGEGVQAVAGQLTRVDVVADFACLGGRGDKAGDEGVQVLGGAGDVLALVQQRGKLAAVVMVLALAERVRLQDGL